MILLLFYHILVDFSRFFWEFSDGLRGREGLRVITAKTQNHNRPSRPSVGACANGFAQSMFE
jgi:hypothetical protein